MFASNSVFAICVSRINILISVTCFKLATCTKWYVRLQNAHVRRMEFRNKG